MTAARPNRAAPRSRPRSARRPISPARALALAAAPAALLSLACGPTASAQDAAPGAETGAVTPIDAPYYVSWVRATLRAEPSPEAEVLAVLGFGSLVTVTGELEAGPWLRVVDDAGRAGWIFAEVLAPAVVAGPGTVPDAGEPGPGATPESPDDTPETATPIDPPEATPAVYEGTIGPDDSADMFRFEASDWTAVTIELDGLSADADIGLLDNTGQAIAESLAGGATSERIESVLAAGTYYIEVYRYDGETDYRLTVSGTPGVPPPDDDAGATPDAAFDLGLVSGEARYEGWVAPGRDDVDYLAFDLPERSRLTVALTGLEADADITLESPIEGELASSMLADTADETIDIALGAGRYLLRVTAFDGETDYVVTVRATPVGEKPTPQ
ncbi:MAG: pre-peptidase C-terminal domain-containing protein [Azospirillaceae bacterium]